MQRGMLSGALRLARALAWSAAARPRPQSIFTFRIFKFSLPLIMTLTLIPMLSLPGGSEWIIIALVVLLLFGGKKIPELMRGLGKGVRNFKDGLNDASKEVDDAAKAATKNPDEKA